MWTCNRKVFNWAVHRGPIFLMFWILLDLSRPCLISAYAQQSHVTAWNGGLTQTGPWFNLFGGDFPFINAIKNAQNWSNGDNSEYQLGNQNPYGFPFDATITAAHSGVVTIVPIPTQTEYPGQWIVDWKGFCGNCGFFNASGLSAKISGGGCRIVNSAGPAGSGLNCTMTYTLTGAAATQGSLQFRVGKVQNANPITSLRAYNINDAAAQMNGEIFGPRFKNTICQFGVIRFLDKGNFNVSAVANWADRTPVSWWNYGANDFVPPNSMASTQITLDSGAEYSVTVPGFTQVDKAHVVAIPASIINAPGGIATTADAPDGTDTLKFAKSTFPTSVIVGMAAANATNGSSIIRPNSKITNISSAGGTTTVTLACSGMCRHSISGDIPVGSVIYFSPMMRVNGGTYYPVVSNSGPAFGSPSTPTSVSAQYSLFTYEAKLGLWMAFNQPSSISAMNGGWPPEVMVQLANECGAHPWFPTPPFTADEQGSVSGQTDYLENLATYTKSNLKAGLIPRFETIPNELWNFGTYGYRYASTMELPLSGVNDDIHNWAGMVASTGGQIISSVYGGDRTKYFAGPGMCPGCQYNVPTGPNTGVQDDELYSTVYAAAGGQRAYLWSNMLTSNTYWDSACDNDSANPTTWLTVGWAYQYQTANPTTQAALITKFLNCNQPFNFSLSAANAVYGDFASYLAAYQSAYSTNITLMAYEGGWGNHNPALQTQKVFAVNTGNPTVLTIAPSWTGYITETTSGSQCSVAIPCGILTVSTTPTPSGATININTPVLCSGCAAQTWATTFLNGPGTTCNPICHVSVAQNSPGQPTPVSMTGDNAWDYICNTANLCGASGPRYTGNPTTTITGVCPELNGNDYAVISATPTTVTINATTDGSCTFSSGGTATYDKSSTWIPAFELAVQTSSLLAPYELTNMQNFYSNGGRFPSLYESTGTGEWSVCYPDVYSCTGMPKITAARQFQSAP
jgi:hypothetical protein